MDFGVFEEEIKAHLVSKITTEGIEFQTMPETEAEFELPFDKSKITVAFSDEEPEPTSKSTFLVAQEVTRSFTVLMQARTLRSTNGIYPVAAQIKRFMRGFRPSFGDKFTYAGFKFVGREKGHFEYFLTFKSKGFEVEEQEEETGPTYTEIVE